MAVKSDFGTLVPYIEMSTENKTDIAGEIINRVTNLPPAPTIAVELLGLFGDPDRDIDRIVELIRLDPSLTAEVLKICNSAYLSAGRERVTDMFDAVNRMGFYEVYCMVVALVGSRALAMARKDSGLDSKAQWLHAVTTAVAASELAKFAQEESQIAFTAGLLHDMGKLVFASVEGSTYGYLVQEAGESGAVLAAKELQVFGVTHAAVGARLLLRWGMPPSVALAVWYHHDSPSLAVSAERMAAIINLGNILAHAMKDGVVNVEDIMERGGEAMEILRLTQNDLPSVVENLQDGMTQVEGLLRLAH